MKLFCPEFNYDPTQRAHLFPILKFIIPGASTKRNLIVNVDSASIYGFDMVTEISIADRVILPMSWNYYLNFGKISEAMELITLAKDTEKLVWMVLLGDKGLPVPEFRNVEVFRASGYFSKLPRWHLGMPIFIADPLKKYFFSINKPMPEYEKNPIIGFCGHATSNVFIMYKRLMIIALKNIAYQLKRYRYTPESLVAAPYLRYKCLKQLESSSKVSTNFILRKKYRAGAITQMDRNQSAKEYFENIADSQYVLCVRGAGNFSTRLYETLAMGRIPVYLHTDGLLPFSDKIDWKCHVVWVDWSDRNRITDKVLMFHRQLNVQRLKKIGQCNRNLWQSFLKKEVFFKKHLA